MTTEQKDSTVELISTMVKALVDAPEKVCLVTRMDTNPDGDRLVVTVSVGESEQGKLIGRMGRTARSLRTIVKAANRKNGLECELVIADSALHNPSRLA